MLASGMQGYALRSPDCVIMPTLLCKISMTNPDILDHQTPLALSGCCHAPSSHMKATYAVAQERQLP